MKYTTYQHKPGTVTLNAVIDPFTELIEEIREGFRNLLSADMCKYQQINARAMMCALVWPSPEFLKDITGILELEKNELNTLMLEKLRMHTPQEWETLFKEGHEKEYEQTYNEYKASKKQMPEYLYISEDKETLEVKKTSLIMIMLDFYEEQAKNFTKNELGID
ncbi:hypothetical protein [Mycoplasmopsis columboralis]|uniref:Uncharacterized protein n=1 Tax=Mycoplasmopsis columboralis TaxID=171282 RepID=A0A449B5X7_9BACT|nr:hypothetical protein [Mycoplasmopsis columboralis]VEU75969.1 Uncharacterised protein [Mycoplasmopsis columboralis]